MFKKFNPQDSTLKSPLSMPGVANTPYAHQNTPGTFYFLEAGYASWAVAEFERVYGKIGGAGA